jgi:hypothetical protein
MQVRVTSYMYIITNICFTYIVFPSHRMVQNYHTSHQDKNKASFRKDYKDKQ